MLNCKDHYNNFPEINKISRNKQYSYIITTMYFQVAIINELLKLNYLEFLVQKKLFGTFRI